MGIVARQSILSSIVSYVGIGVGYVNLLYLYPKFLDPNQIGLLRTIQDAAILMTPFATFGLAQSIVRFFPQFASDKRSAAGFLSLILLLSTLTYGLFLLAFFLLKSSIVSFFATKAADVVAQLDLILWLTFFLLGITLLEQYSRSLLKAAFPAFLREVVLRVFQGALVSFYFLKWITFQQLLVLSVAIYTLTLAILAVYLLSLGHFKLSFQWKEIPRQRLKDIVVFSSLSFIGTSSMILVGKMDSVMVAALLGLASNAVYTNAFYMATVIEIPKRAITSLASPLIANAFGKNDMKDVLTIYQKTSINQLIVGGLLLLGVLANFPNIFQLMPKGEIYRAGQFVVVIVGVGKLIDMAFGPSSEIIGLSPYYWFNLVVITLLAGITVASNYVLIPSLGIDGAAYGSLLALVVYNASKFVFIYVRLGIQPFTRGTLKVFLICIVVAAIGYYLPRITSVFADIAYRSCIMTAVYGILIYTSKVSPDINRLVNEGMHRIKKFGNRWR